MPYGTSDVLIPFDISYIQVARHLKLGSVFLLLTLYLFLDYFTSLNPFTLSKGKKAKTSH